jgi:hypothetical protein
VGAAHHVTAIADLGRAPFRRPAVHRAIFAESIVVPDPDFAAGLRPKREILRVTPEHRSISDEIVFTHAYRSADDRVGGDDASRSDARAAFDYGEGSNLHVVSKLRCPIDHGGGMNVHARKAGK